jgi:hypothetical protein
MPWWLPRLVVALRMRIFARINGEQGIPIPGDLVDVSRFRQIYSHPAANGRSQGAALSDLFWYWLSPGPEIHQEHIEPGARYEEVARTTRRILALQKHTAEEMTAGCVARVFDNKPVRGIQQVRLRDVTMPVWAEFYHELVFGKPCSPEARDLIVGNANDVVTALKCCGLRHMEKRYRLTEFLVSKIEAGEVAQGLPECLSVREQALYLQGVFFNTAVVQMSEAMTHLLLAVAQNQDVQARLTAYPDDEHYYGLVINETLRRYPLFGIAHRITSAEIPVDGRTTIPPGAVVCFNYPEFHRAGFEDPDRFDPGRWEKLSAREQNFIPFGIAANRPCPALGLTPLTMSVAAREMLKRFAVLSSASHVRSIPNRGPCLLLPRTDELHPWIRKALLARMDVQDRWEDVWRSIVQLVLGTYMVWDARRLRLCQRYFEALPANTGQRRERSAMEPMNGSDLLQVCVERMSSVTAPMPSASRLNGEEECAMQRWWKAHSTESAELAATFIARPETDWTEMILEHRAHRHPWYEELAHEASLGEYAAFLLENRGFPAFLPLVQRALEAQVCDEGRAAVLRNIEDEQVPVPHAELMRRLIQAVKARIGNSVPLESFPSLVNRTLVFYYGYYCDPWHLIGSLYATEAMALHRMTQMNTGLRRLGFKPEELEFIEVHLGCDEGHASDWSNNVVQPSLRVNPDLRRPVAQGVAACLQTSAWYLDDLSRRAAARSVVCGA